MVQLDRAALHLGMQSTPTEVLGFVILLALRRSPLNARALIEHRTRATCSSVHLAPCPLPLHPVAEPRLKPKTKTIFSHGEEEVCQLLVNNI